MPDNSATILTPFFGLQPYADSSCPSRKAFDQMMSEMSLSVTRPSSFSKVRIIGLM